MVTTPEPPPLVALSAVFGGPVQDSAGAEVGRVVVVTPPGWGYPVVSGVLLGGHDSGTVVATDHLAALTAALTAQGVTLSVRAPLHVGVRGVVTAGQVLLQADVLGHRVLDLACGRWLRGRDAIPTRRGH